MIMDMQNLLTGVEATGVLDQSVTVTARSTNTIDLGANGAGKGNPVKLLIQVVETFTADGAATLNVDLCTDEDSDCSDGTVLVSSGAIAKASLVAGYEFTLECLPKLAQQFIDLNLTVATGPMTAGKLRAGIVMDKQHDFSN